MGCSIPVNPVWFSPELLDAMDAFASGESAPGKVVRGSPSKGKKVI